MTSSSVASAQPVTAADLRGVEEFAGLSNEELQWIATRCELLVLEPGDALFEAGETAEWMYICIEGVLQLRRDNQPAEAPIFTTRAGEITGTIPFSRMVTYPVTARATVHTRIARFPKTGF